jgi:hypothetical protein
MERAHNVGRHLVQCLYVKSPGFQQIACVDTDTGELSERRLAHREQAEQFYRELKQQNLCARVGLESSGHSRWFERLLQELGFEQLTKPCWCTIEASCENDGRQA